MPNDPAASSTAAPPEGKGDAKSDNVTVSSTAHQLLKREVAAIEKAKLSANVAPAAQEDAAALAKTPETPEGEQKPKGDEKPAETKAETAKADAELDAALSNDSTLTPEQQERFEKRLAKERRLRGDSDRRVQELEAKLAALQAAPPPPPIEIKPTADNPLANIQDLGALQKEQATAKETKRWAEEVLDREDIDKGIQFDGRTLTKQEIKAVLRGANRLLEDHIPARQAFLNTRQQAEQQASQQFDWMKAPSSEEYAQWKQILRTEPALMNDPAGPWKAAIAVEGIVSLKAKIESQKRGKGPAPAERTAAPASQLAGGAAPGPSRGESTSGRAKAALDAEMSKMKNGSGGVSRDQVAKFLSRREQSQSR